MNTTDVTPNLSDRFPDGEDGIPCDACGTNLRDADAMRGTAGHFCAECGRFLLASRSRWGVSRNENTDDEDQE